MKNIFHHLCILALATAVLLFWGCERENFDVIDPLEGRITPDTSFCGLTLEVSKLGRILVADVNGGEQPYAYLWSVGETGPQIEIDSVGTYGVTVTDAIGCMITGVQVVANEAECDLITITIIEEEAPEGIALVAIAENATPPIFYSWGDDEPPGQVFFPPATGTYTVLVLDDEGCIVSQSYDYG